jgi:hypothetical protein
MKTQEFLKIQSDVLLEINWDTDDIRQEDWVHYTNNDIKLFAFYDANGTSTYGGLNNAFIKWDDDIALRYTDPTINPNLQIWGAEPLPYCKMKLWFPLGFLFSERLGFVFETTLYDLAGSPINLGNFAFVWSEEPNRLKQERPFIFAEKRWSQSVEISIPSAYAISLQKEWDPLALRWRILQNSMNSRLTDNIGISEASPYVFTYRWVNSVSIETIDNLERVYYNLGLINQQSIAIQPQFAQVGIVLEESSEGDYLEYYFTWEGSQAKFQEWMTNQTISGNSYTISMDVRVLEEGIETWKLPITLESETDFLKKQILPLILQNTQIAASVDITAIFTLDKTGSSFIRRAAINLIGAATGRYSKNRVRLALDNAEIIKLYNSRPANIGVRPDIDFLDDFSIEPWSQFYQDPQSFIPDGDSLPKQSGSVVKIVKVPYPVMVEKWNIIGRTQSQVNNGVVWWGNGLLELVIHPFDNAYILQLAESIESNSVKLRDLSQFETIDLIIKSPTKTIKTPLFLDIGQVDLKKGILSYKITAIQVEQIRPLFNSNWRQFYLTVGPSSGTVLYFGQYILSDSDEYQRRMRDLIDANLPDNTLIKTLDPGQDISLPGDPFDDGAPVLPNSGKPPKC